MTARPMNLARMTWLGVLLAALLGAWAMPAGAKHLKRAEEPTILGHWLSEKEKLIVELYPCGSEVCGRIAWLANTHKDGELRRDVKNPDPALRRRPWCGIEVIRGLEPEGDGAWDGGRVYDPKRGETYSLAAEAVGEDRLKLRAYMGIKLLGKTETWSRPDPDHEIACVAGS